MGWLLLCWGYGHRKSAQISSMNGLSVRFSIWRSGWDSNPRAREDYLISSVITS